MKIQTRSCEAFYEVHHPWRNSDHRVAAESLPRKHLAHLEVLVEGFGQLGRAAFPHDVVVDGGSCYPHGPIDLLSGQRLLFLGVDEVDQDGLELDGVDQITLRQDLEDVRLSAFQDQAELKKR